METKVGLILDCDGTLIDSIGAWHEAERSLCDEAGIVLSKDERDELNTLTLEEAAGFFHNRFGIRASDDEVAEAIIGYLLQFYRERSQANPGAAAFVKAAHESGMALSVLSSSPQEFLQAGLTRAEMLPYIEHVVSVEDLSMTKRDPAIYLYMCDLIGTDPTCTWLFDDSWYALQTARSAGLRTVGVFSSDNCGTHDELGRFGDIVVDTFEEISPDDLR